MESQSAFRNVGPRGYSLAIRCGFEAMNIQHIGHCGIGNVVSGIPEGSLDPIVAPRGILRREPNNGVNDFRTDSRPTRL